VCAFENDIGSQFALIELHQRLCLMELPLKQKATSKPPQILIKLPLMAASFRVCATVAVKIFN